MNREGVRLSAMESLVTSIIRSPVIVRRGCTWAMPTDSSGIASRHLRTASVMLKAPPCLGSIDSVIAADLGTRRRSLFRFAFGAKGVTAPDALVLSKRPGAVESLISSGLTAHHFAPGFLASPDGG